MELLQHPVIEGIIAAVIFISILAEIKTAGFSGGGLVAVIFGILLIWGRWYDGGWHVAEALLYFGGLVWIFADLLFLMTGAAAAAGLASVAASLYFIFGADGKAVYILAAGIVLAIAGMAFLAGHLSENRLWKKISLQLSLTSQKGYVSSAKDLTIWEGRKGTARSVLRPSGKVEVDGVILDAVTEGEFVETGKPVTVIRAESGRVVVRAEAE